MVYVLLSAKRRAYFCKTIAIEMGGVSRYFSKVSGSGVDVTLPIFQTHNRTCTALFVSGQTAVVPCEGGANLGVFVPIWRVIRMPG